MKHHAICDACETVAHCWNNGCVPLVCDAPTRVSHRTLRDHAPQIADTLLTEAEQRTRMHRALGPAPARVATDSLAARLAAQPNRPIETPSLLVSILILVVACMAVAGLIGLIAHFTGAWK